jgi:hypothetical protein
MKKPILAVAAFAALVLGPASPVLAHGSAHHSPKARAHVHHRSARFDFKFLVGNHRAFTKQVRPRSVAHSASVTCDKVAAPAGSDAHGDGSVANPYATVGKLDAALTPGQTGCLETGTYGSLTTDFYLTSSGTASGQITITSYPGQRAKLLGMVDLLASYTTLSRLAIDGSNTLYDAPNSFNPCNQGQVSQSLQINGNGDVFEHNDYYQSIAALRGNGIGVGFNGPANNVIIRYNRIHDVGSCQAFDHLIYLDSGNGAQIYDNWLYNDANGFGMQVYPHASGAHIFANVIDHVGSGFTVGGTSATSNNVIDHNIVTNSTGLPNAGTKGQCLGDYWETAPGTGNTFNRNDCFQNPDGVGSATAVSMVGNTTTDPRFVDPGTHNYVAKSTSPFAGWGLWNGN